MISAEEKVWDYLKTHKAPVLATTLAKRFLLSKSHTVRILKSLELAQKIQIVTVGSQRFYMAKERHDVQSDLTYERMHK